jgi:hypothetical protein
MVSMAHGSAPMVKAKLAPKAWAERSRLPRLTAFEAPSMPMAKNPRAVAGRDFTARLCHKRRLGGHKSTIDGSILQLHQLDALTENRKPAIEEQLRQPQPSPIGLKVRLCLEDEVPAIGCGWRVVTCQFRRSKVALLHAGYSATIKRADFKQIVVGTRRARAMAVDGVGRTTGGTHG